MDLLNKAAAELYRAHLAGESFRPLTGELCPDSITDAYRIQQAFQLLHAKNSDGRGIIGGRKIALASKVQQELCGIDHPIGGGIFANDIQASPASVELTDYYGLGVEYEIAITLTDSVSTAQQHSGESIRELVATVHPAFELITDRGADYEQLHALTMIAENAWCAGVILGPDIGTGHDINNLPVTLNWNDEPAQRASSSASDPLGSLAWVVNLVTSMGETIEAGQPIITGSVMKTRYPVEGDLIRFSIDDHADISLQVS